MTTTWPLLRCWTPLPTASTTPMASWPMRWPSPLGPPLYGQRSLPQMQARVMRITASVGCSNGGVGNVLDPNVGAMA